MRFAAILTLAASPALADTGRTLETHVLPGHTALVAATEGLAAAATLDCKPDTVRPVFHAAYDAWINISHIQFGPIEDQGLSLAMSFWPDPKDSTGKAIGRLTAAQDPIVDDPDAFGEVSAAAQGFTALERLLYDDQPDTDYACRLTQAVATGLAQKARTLSDGWSGHANLMRAAGSNDRYQSPEEAQRALYTALSTGLEFLHDQRLARPLGTFDRPRPRRAEARRSARSLRHIELSLAALEDLAKSIYEGDLTETRAAFAEARARAAELDDPALEGVADPANRFKVEVLQRSVNDIRNAVNTEIGKPLGITAGFNALDGD